MRVQRLHNRLKSVNQMRLVNRLNGGAHRMTKSTLNSQDSLAADREHHFIETFVGQMPQFQGPHELKRGRGLTA